jgi:hypothetical protein
MATERRTISIPPALAARLDQEAAERNMSFSALIVELIEQGQGRSQLPYKGIIDDDEDLSQRIEEILSRLGR